jgi:hypothetical protein
MLKKLHTVADLYQHFDSLFDQDIDNDTLFASSYLRGLLSSAVSSTLGEQQEISAELIDLVTDKLARVKTELSPQDNAIVQNYWLVLQQTILN